MEINSPMKREIKSELSSVFNETIQKVSEFSLLTGADAITFSFTAYPNNHKIPLILRIFREITDQAEREFNTLFQLKKVGLSVPKPFLWKKKSKTFSKSYLIMEQIPGTMAADYLFHAKDNEKNSILFSDFIKELVKIHNFNWKEAFPKLKQPDVKKNPYFFIERVLNFPKYKIITHKLKELLPLIEWLEINKIKCEKLSLLHGDYHLNNIIRKPDGTLVVIDWANIFLGDYRYDLGFAIVATSSIDLDVSKLFTNYYENFSGEKVENIEYFMVLSLLHNILRIYSALVKPEITNENETTKNLFIKRYTNYTRNIIWTVKRITNITLKTIEDHL